MWLHVNSTRAVAFLGQSARRARPRRCPSLPRPDRQRRHRRLGASCAGSAGRRPCARRPIHTAARHCWHAGSPENGEPSVTTARTRSGRARASSRAKTPPRLHPTTSTGRGSSIASSRAASRSIVSAFAPRFQPSPHGWTRHPARRQRAAQFHRRPVVGDEAGDDQRRRAVLGPARPQMPEPAPRPRAEPRRLRQPHPPRRRRVVRPYRNSPPPIRSRSAWGRRTRPSAVWWFSSSGTRIRGLASAVLLSVWAKRTLPSASR